MQFKLPAYILFAVASFFLILHNVTPHLHHGEISENRDAAQALSSNNFLDYLLLSFQHDHGEGHMEWFSESNHIDQNAELSQFLKADFIHAFSLLNIKDLEYHEETPVWLISYNDIPVPLILGNPLRAPPVKV
jgi:hypothetical protein